MRKANSELIPAEALLRQALVRIGQLESYITELEDKIRLFESRKILINDIQKEAVAEARKTQFVKRLENRLSKQGAELNRLYQGRSELAQEISRLRRELEQK